MPKQIGKYARCNSFKLAHWPHLCQKTVPSQSIKTCNAIDDLLHLTLIKMEHVQEIKLSLSCCNEILSIIVLFTLQSDKMIKLRLNQDFTQCHHRNLLASLF